MTKIDPKKFTYKEESRIKSAFYASDVLKPNLDLYFSLTNEPKTNPVKWSDTLKFGAGNGVEMQLLKVLKMNGIVPEDYDQKEHGRIEIERNGIKINGYIDAKTVDGEPIEIKSINNANKFDILKYENGNPRESYVGQLSIYMDALGKDLGYLFVASIDGLHYFVFECKRMSKRKFKCGKVIIDLDKEYERWSNLYNNYVVKNILPDVNEYVYKHDVDTIDWDNVSVSEISKARNGHKVLGDWQVLWSPWKDKIIELQGSTLGYTNKELSTILEKTKGYSSRKKSSSAKKKKDEEEFMD